jgi:soluble lytic murein transglycosylase-like protein
VIFLFRLTAGIDVSPVANAAPLYPSNNGSNPELESVSVISQAATGCALSSSFPTEVTQWCGLITAYAEQHGLSADLIAALIWLESGGDQVAYSRSGAVGLMQVMPRDGIASSFMCKNGPCFTDRPTTAELQDPEFNISFGTRMLAKLLQRSGSMREALKNYGPMNVGYTYADKVLAIYERHRQ